MTLQHFSLNIHLPLTRARAHGTVGAPLEVFAGDDGYSGVTFFCGDDALATALAEAINRVIAEHKATAAAADIEEAA